jgi:serine/threonine protein kinase
VLPWRKAVQWIAGISEAVAHAHQLGIFHRDLKPQNILIDQNEQIHLADFGLARRLEDTVGITLTGGLVGTLHYVAPEALENPGASLSVASEIYSIGAILYETLTGVPPFGGHSLAEITDNIRRNEAVPPRKIRPSIPIKLENICLRCLRKSPEKRFTDANDLLLALRSCLQDSTTPVQKAISGRHVVWLLFPLALALLGIVTLAICRDHRGLRLSVVDPSETNPPIIHSIV